MPIFKSLKIKGLMGAGLLALLFSLESKSSECRDAFQSLSGNKRPVRAGLNDRGHAQYIVKRSNKTVGNLYHVESIPEEALGEKGVYYHPDVREIVESFASRFDGRVITRQKAEELYIRALQIKGITWNDIREGCAARAHLMAREFESSSVYVDKAWASGELFVKRFGETYAGWSFHVAPVVYVKSVKGKIEKMVIDPSIFGRPVSVDRWVDRLNFFQKEVVRTSYPVPDIHFEFEIISLAFSNSDAFDRIADHDLSEEDKLFRSYEAMDKLKEGRSAD